MPISNPYLYSPIGSLALISEQNRIKYIELFYETPKNLRSVLTSPDTASYVNGLGKSYDVPEENFPKIAQTIFFVAIGKRSMGEISAVLSSDLGLPNEQAQKMASEIEHDIFGPVKAELDEFLSRKAPALRLAPLAQSKQPVQNLLDLKEIAATKRQELLTTRPARPSLPTPTPHPSPLPVRGEGNTTPPPVPPKFPLPPKPPTSPISFTGY